MEHKLKPIVLPLSSSATLIALKVDVGTKIRNGTLLAEYLVREQNGNARVLHMRSSIVGVVKTMHHRDGDIVAPNEPLFDVEEVCEHSIVVFDMCADCGLNLRRTSTDATNFPHSVSASVSMIHGIPELRVSQEEAEKLGSKDRLRLLTNRKLSLIVDLDQTLVHTSMDSNIPPGLPDVYGFHLPDHHVLYHCRLRPYTRQFLDRVAELYELHVFTMGTKSYAASVTRILDPERKLFSDRIISRDECFDPRSKSLRLKSLFPCGDSMVAIIDDREDVWGRSPNLVHVKPYVFFSGTSDINAPPPHPSKLHHPHAPKVKRRNKANIPLQAHHSMAQRNDAETPGKAVGSETTHTHHSLEHNSTNSESLVPDEKSGKVSSYSEHAGSSFGKESSHTETTSSEEILLTNTNSNNNNRDGDDDEEEEEEGGASSSNDSSDDSSSSSSSSGIDDSLFDPPPKDGEDVREEKSQMEEEKLISPEGRCEGKDPNEMSGEQGVTSHISKSEVISGSVPSSESVLIQDTPAVPPPAHPVVGSPNRPAKIEDADDFLIHLTDILTRIYETFYERFDTMTRDTDVTKTAEFPIPDLKLIIPELRHSILKDCQILFTGVIPTNMPVRKNPAWNTARAFGAGIHEKLVPGLDSPNEEEVLKATSHVIAGRPGTSKLLKAEKLPGIKIVTPQWLWACAERWKRVDENSYLAELGRKKKKGSEDDLKEKLSWKGPPESEHQQVNEGEQDPNDGIESAMDTFEGNDEKPQTDSSGESSDDDNIFRNSAAVLANRGTTELQRHLSRESRLSVSDDELERMVAEVDAEISSSSGSSNNSVSKNVDEEREALGSVVEHLVEDNEGLSYDKFTGMHASEDIDVLERLSRKRRFVEVETSSSSDSQVIGQHLNDSFLSDDDLRENDSADEDEDEDDDELGALLGYSR